MSALDSPLSRPVLADSASPIMVLYIPTVAMLDVSISTFVKNRLKLINSDASTIPMMNCLILSILSWLIMSLIPWYKSINIKPIFMRSLKTFQATFMPVIAFTLSAICIIVTCIVRLRRSPASDRNNESIFIIKYTIQLRIFGIHQNGLSQSQAVTTAEAAASIPFVPSIVTSVVSVFVALKVTLISLSVPRTRLEFVGTQKASLKSLNVLVLSTPAVFWLVIVQSPSLVA